MFATKVRTIPAAELCCVLALACATSATHFANAQPQPEPKPRLNPLDLLGLSDKPAPENAPAKADGSDRHFALIPLKKLDATDATATLLKVLPKEVTVAAVRDKNAILVYATAKGTDDVKLVLRTLGEPLPKEEPQPNAPEPKTYTFRMKNVPWAEVFEAYAKLSGLTLVTAVKPTGTFTFEPPAGQQLTLAEITDILNEALARQKFILVRRERTFFLHPADEKLDPTAWRRVQLEDLPQLGRTELVEVQISLTNGFDANDVKNELPKLLTPFGEIVFARGKSFVVRDTVGNIHRIREILEAVAKPKGASDALDHLCKWRRAQEVAETLKTLLTDKDTVVTLTGPHTTNNGGKGVQIAVDTRRNAVVVTASPDKIVLTKRIVSELDKPRTPQDTIFKPTEPVVKTYSVLPGSATELAKIIQTKMPWLQCIPLQKQDQIMVLAIPEDHLVVVKLLQVGDEGTKPAPKKK